MSAGRALRMQPAAFSRGLAHWSSAQQHLLRGSHAGLVVAQPLRAPLQPRGGFAEPTAFRPSNGLQLRFRRGERGAKKETKKQSQSSMNVRSLDDVCKGIPSGHADVHFDWPGIKDNMLGSLTHLQRSLSALLVGRVTPELIADTTIHINGYDAPLKSLGQITVQGPQKLLLTVHRDLPQIHKALQLLPNQEAQIQVEPTGIGFTFPKLTRERREELVLLVRQKGDLCKESLRNIHRKGTTELKKLKPSDDDHELIKEDLQQLQNQAIAYSRHVVEDKVSEIENA